MSYAEIQEIISKRITELIEDVVEFGPNSNPVASTKDSLRFWITSAAIQRTTESRLNEEEAFKRGLEAGVEIGKEVEIPF